MVLGGWLSLLLTAGTVSLPAPPSCQYLVRGVELLRLDPQPSKIGDLPAGVNALAYAPDQDLYYGISGDEIVTVTPEGVLTWRGETPAGLRDAYAGAITKSQWHLMGTQELLIVDIAPESPTYLTVVQRVRLSHDPRLGDWDVAPVDGALYGVDTDGPGSGSVIRIDPATGVVAALASPDSLPGTGAYGSIVIDAEMTMHALHNPTGVLFHIPLADPALLSATPIGPPAKMTDGASCPRVSPSPPSPSPPSPSASPTPPLPSPPLPSPSLSPPIPPLPEPVPPIFTQPPPSPGVTPTVSPTVSPSKVLVYAPATSSPVPEESHPIRAFFLGMLIPALVVVARGVRRARR